MPRSGRGEPITFKRAGELNKSSKLTSVPASTWRPRKAMSLARTPILTSSTNRIGAGSAASGGWALSHGKGSGWRGSGWPGDRRRRRTGAHWGRCPDCHRRRRPGDRGLRRRRDRQDEEDEGRGHATKHRHCQILLQICRFIGGSGRRAERVQRLQPRRPAMPAELAADHAPIGHPVELQRAARADMRAMAVKRARAAPERQHRAGERRHLARVVVEIVRAAQQPQPPLCRVSRPGSCRAAR